MCVWMYLVYPQVHLCTDTPFWPSADNNAMGVHYGGQKALLRTVRETLPEEMKSVLQSPLPPTVFSLTKDSDKEKKKKAVTYDKKDRFYYVILSLLHSPSVKHLFFNSKHHESKWIKSLALGLHCRSCYFKEQQLNNQPKRTHWRAAAMWFYHSAWTLTWSRKEKELDRFQEEWQP